MEPPQHLSSTHLSPASPSNPSRTRSASSPWSGSMHGRYGSGGASSSLSSSLGSSSVLNSSSPPGFSGPSSGSSPRLQNRSLSRSLSSNAIAKASVSFGPELAALANQQTPLGTNAQATGARGNRARSSSLVTVTEVGGDDHEMVVDRLGNENAAWVNAPGAWLIHPVLLLVAKVLVDAIPGMTQDLSWTILNLGYMIVSYIMFHFVTGIPIESSVLTGGAYDDLTLWEQIDSGAQYTPAKKWLTSVPICLFLVSTHYTKYDSLLFVVNFLACLCATVPKLPALHRLRFHFLPSEPAPGGTSVAATPLGSRPPSPGLKTIPEGSKEK